MSTIATRCEPHILHIGVAKIMCIVGGIAILHDLVRGRDREWRIPRVEFALTLRVRAFDGG